ncbi:MAG: glycine cleavage system aminomethyltransferase GcvT [Roseovarius sp.]|nr:glycine cleavage system aminomethyltransferase GcvT [Roseovarius sp.]MCY4207879.1 glycine cleavage system aminomethyltransferase GcvT [Roseovarius sp.]MCY4316367.1 glycine cleavage system aminomethyltransferase GcvT [Roseovarius sp.]
MSELVLTSLNELHKSMGAKMVPYAGHEMPVQYPMGIMREHLHTRKSAGFFDVSHMGQIIVRHEDGLEAAARAVEALVPIDILGLRENRQRYGFFTNENGGIRDDLMISNRGDHLYLVVNAACKAADLEYMRSELADCDVREITDRSLLAIQGPMAEEVLDSICIDCRRMKFLDAGIMKSDYGELWISRSGYTGEDGFEISLENGAAERFARDILLHEAVTPVGIGARDSLRLEAGLCLYGNDIDHETSPVEASLNWTIQRVRRKGGEREGGFPGAGAVLDQLEHGTDRVRVGLLPLGRAPLRKDVKLFLEAEGGESIGVITSGSFGPTLEKPVSMGYVKTCHASAGSVLFGELRGRRLEVTVSKMPFTQANFKR